MMQINVKIEENWYCNELYWLSHLHPQFHHDFIQHIKHLQTYKVIHTPKFTHWLPRHTTRRLLFYSLRAVSEGSTAKVGLAITDKSGLTRWWEKSACTPLESITASTRGEVPMVHDPNSAFRRIVDGQVQLFNLMAYRPQDQTEAGP